MANINKIRLSGTTYNIEDENASKTVELTQAQYDALATKEPNTYYVITDATAVDMSNYYTKAQTDTALATKQATLVSGTNIKTINNESILGSGNIELATQSDFETHTGDTAIHVTSAEKTAWNNKSNFSGSYNDLTNKPTIPTTTSELTNDSNFVTTATTTPINNTLTAHTADTTIHVTSAEKTAWNGAATNASNAITALGGLKLVSLTQAQYDALSTKDASTIYFING